MITDKSISEEKRDCVPDGSGIAVSFMYRRT